MAVTLEGIELPSDIQWINEFEAFGVGQTVTPTLSGALVIQESLSSGGRNVKIESGDGAWITRATARAISALAATPLDDGQTLTLDWHGTTYSVVFDRSSGNGFAATEVLRLAADAQNDFHPFTVSISLIVQG
jgi:hypothetical protein